MTLTRMVWARQFGFSTAVLALIFAVYALVLIPALLLFGQLSDRLGRRPVIAIGLGLAMLALVLFALATGVAWLFAARAVLGVAQGMLSGAATAALAELSQAGGSATGVPVIGIGVLAVVTTLFTAVTTFAVVTGGCALAIAAWHWRNRAGAGQAGVHGYAGEMRRSQLSCSGQVRRRVPPAGRADHSRYRRRTPAAASRMVSSSS